MEDIEHQTKQLEKDIEQLNKKVERHLADTRLWVYKVRKVTEPKKFKKDLKVHFE